MEYSLLSERTAGAMFPVPANRQLGKFQSAIDLSAELP